MVPYKFKPLTGAQQVKPFGLDTLAFQCFMFCFVLCCRMLYGVLVEILVQHLAYSQEEGKL